MSDTPRTDAEARKLEHGIACAKGEYVSAGLSRQLERELAAALKAKEAEDRGYCGLCGCYTIRVNDDDE